jgi:hypothetical protein
VASRRAGDGSIFTAAQEMAAGVWPPGSSWGSLKETALIGICEKGIAL